MKLKSVLTHLCGAVSIALCAVTAQAQQVLLNVVAGTPVMLAGTKQTAFMKVGLTGFQLKSEQERAPVNIAIVLDRSGSMAGDKLEHAKQAAIMAVERLGPNDVASVIVYDDVVQLVVPATKVTDKNVFRQAIRRIQAGGSTALFAGVSKGAKEVQKFLDRNRVNRVILLSDGLANVGPSSPAELGNLGASLAKQGISVTTFGLGLGYNEDLMTRLAGMSDGNHAFVEDPEQLSRMFDAEFGDVLSVVAQEVRIRIRCADGIKPLRVLGRDADIAGQDVGLAMNQLYGAQEKFVLLEVEVPARTTGQQQALADVDVSYFNAVTRKSYKLNGKLAISFTDSADKVAAATNRSVMAVSVEQVSNQISKEAVKLKDEGKLNEARQKLEEGASYLEQNAQTYQAPELSSRGQEFRKDAENLEDDANWNRNRKAISKRQYSIEKQQKY